MNEIELTLRQAGDRVLAVLYEMTRGDINRSITKADLMAECRRLGILEMSDAQFSDYLHRADKAALVDMAEEITLEITAEFEPAASENLITIKDEGEA
jgi:predicted metalloprotease with PDZ domain